MPEIIIEGLTATVIGMGMVFGVLAILCVILSFFKYLTPRETKPQEAAPTVDYTENDEAEFTDVTDDAQLIAVISAAIAAYLGQGVKITSIKYADRQATPPRASYKGWTAAAIRENHRGLY